MPIINLKDYDNCERFGHQFDGIPGWSDAIPVIDGKTGKRTGASYTSYCKRCNLDRVGWRMPKAFWNRKNKETK